MKIFKNRPIFSLTVLTGVFLLFGLGLIYFNIDEFSSPVILHFDSFRGIDFFGEKADLWGIWATAFLAILLNIGLGRSLFYRERSLSYVLLGANFLISILLLVVLGVIVSVN